MRNLIIVFGLILCSACGSNTGHANGEKPGVFDSGSNTTGTRNGNESAPRDANADSDMDPQSADTPSVSNTPRQ